MSFPIEEQAAAEAAALETLAAAPRGSLNRNPDFLRLWGAEGVSQLGSQITAIALPLVAATTLQATPLEFGVLAAASWLPYLVFGLAAGVWVDRLRRKPVMVATDVLRAAALLAVPAAAATGRMSVAVLVATAFVVGSLTVFFNVAYVAYLPTLVGRSGLVEGNAKLEATASAAQIVGPAMAGTLIGAVSAPFALLFNAATFVLSALGIGAIRAPEPPPVPAGERLGWRREVGDGLRVVAGNPTLRALTLVDATVSVGGFAFLAIYILYMVENLRLSADQIGFVLATGGAGALIGAWGAGRLRTRLGIGPAIVLSMLAFGLTGLLVPLAVLAPRFALPLVVASEFLQWAAIVAHAVNAVSLRQAIAPERMQGRVNGTMRFVSNGLKPVGSLAGGVLGGVIGLPLTLVVGEVGMLLAVGWYLTSPVWATRDLPEPLEEPG